MLDQKQFKMTLRGISSSVTTMRKSLQDVAIYCIHQACVGKNPNPIIELYKAVTVDKDMKREYVTQDAGRVLAYIQAYAPVNIVKGEVKFVKSRADKVVWQHEKDYPNWWDWAKTTEPVKERKKNYLGNLIKSVSETVTAIKSGDLEITEETKPQLVEMVATLEDVLAEKLSEDIDHPMRRSADKETPVLRRIAKHQQQAAVH